MSIALPKMQTPKLPMDMDSLMSPARTLINTHFHPLDAAIPMISAPDPGQLPHPDKLLGKCELVLDWCGRFLLNSVWQAVPAMIRTIQA